MNYILDTCVISDFFKKDKATISHFQNSSPQELHISSISVMEIEYGLKLNPERERKIRPLWETLLTLIEVISYSKLCAEATSQLRAELKDRGLPIGPYDILIAGTALAFDMTLVTANSDEFSRLKQLRLENWRL